ncbi:MAG: hypothetical protein Q8R36_05165, partial [bacterium]|nr:hypothetical protein [bacterium]
GKGKETIKHKEIAELREPLKNILAEMRENIDRGDYGLIIGDDASGRIPTWFFYNFLKELYKGKKMPPPKVRYFAGGYRVDPSQFSLGRSPFKERASQKFEKIEMYLAQAKKDMGKSNLLNKKALVVTDAIGTGSTLQPIIEALQKQNTPFDIATVSSFNDLTPRFEGKVFSGQDQSPSIYRNHELAGVVKDRKHVFAEPYKTYWARLAEGVDPNLGISPFSPEETEELQHKHQERINEARKDAEILAHELAEWYQKTAVVKATQSFQ